MFKFSLILASIVVVACVETKPGVTECEGDPPSRIEINAIRSGLALPCTVSEAEVRERKFFHKAIKPQNEFMSCIIDEAQIDCEFQPSVDPSGMETGLYACKSSHPLLAGIQDFDPWETFTSRGKDCPAQ